MNNCKYCNDVGDGPSKRLLDARKKLGIIDRSDVCNIDIFAPNKMTIGVFDFVTSIKINYCPMCGRKLIDQEAADEQSEDM